MRPRTRPNLFDCVQAWALAAVGWSLAVHTASAQVLPSRIHARSPHGRCTHARTHACRNIWPKARPTPGTAPHAWAPGVVNDPEVAGGDTLVHERGAEKREARLTADTGKICDYHAGFLSQTPYVVIDVGEGSRGAYDVKIIRIHIPATQTPNFFLRWPRRQGAALRFVAPCGVGECPRWG